MAFRVRPFRPKIYEPMRKFGVVIEDGPFVLLFGLFAFFLCYLLNLRIYGFPLQTPALLGGFAAGVLFFNWMRVGKRSGHLQHIVMDFLTGGEERRGWLPSDLEAAGSRPTTCIIQNKDISGD